MFSFQLRPFNFHWTVSLYASDYHSNYDSVASENKPVMICSLATREVEQQLSREQLQYFWLKQCLKIVTLLVHQMLLRQQDADIKGHLLVAFHASHTNFCPHHVSPINP